MDFILDTTCVKVLTAWVMAADGSGEVKEDALLGRVSVIDVFLSRYDGSQVLPSSIMGLRIWVASSVVYDNDVAWIMMSGMGYESAPPASGLAVNSISCPILSSVSPFLEPSSYWTPISLVMAVKCGLKSLTSVRAAPPVPGLVVDM